MCEKSSIEKMLKQYQELKSDSKAIQIKLSNLENEILYMLPNKTCQLDESTVLVHDEQTGEYVLIQAGSTGIDIVKLPFRLKKSTAH